jgi:DNA-binding NtrC family response regulator
VPNEQKRVRVLIVDDEEMIAGTLVQILNASGFEARAAFTGEEALSIASDFRPEILLTDVIMRGMSGVDAGMAIAKAHPNCRVILFSGQAATSDLLDHAMGQGFCFELVAKPIHPTDLLKTLRSGDC